MATIASLVVDISANTIKLTKDVEHINTKLDSLKGVASNAGKALAAAFTVTAIVGAAKQVIDFADRLTNLSAKTAISTTALQQWELAFAQSGISLETVTAAAVRLAQRLIAGDKSTVGALTKLGLSVQALKQMAPEEQFLTVADAIGRIPNPTEKAYAALAIFGKGGTELLAGLTGHLRETTEEFERMGLVIDEETLQAADTFADELGVMAKQLLGVVATIVGPLLPGLSALGQILMWVGGLIQTVITVAIKIFQTAVGSLLSRVAEFLAMLSDLAQRVPLVGKHLGALGTVSDRLRAFAEGTSEAVGDLWANVDQVGTSAKRVAPALLGLGEDTEKAEQAAKKYAAEVAKVHEKISTLEVGIGSLASQMTTVTDNTLVQVRAYVALTEGLATAERHAYATRFGMISTVEGLEDIGRKVDVVVPKIVTLGTTIRGAFASLPDLLIKAFTGGGGVMGGIKALGTQIGSDLFGPDGAFAGATKAMQGGLTKVLGSTIGGALGAAIPGIGALIGPAITGIGKLFGKIFGESEKEKVDKMRQAWIDSAGGWGAINEMAATAGMTLDKVLNATNVKDYQAALLELENGVAASKLKQEEAFTVLDETVKKYKFSIEELGPALSRQDLDKQAQEIFKDWEILTNAGIDVAAVGREMQDKINAFIGDAVKMGSEVPSAMKPMLEKMMEMGLLTDASGNKITDLEGSGITFSETMTEGFKKVVDSVKSLTDIIAKALGIELPQTAETAKGALLGLASDGSEAMYGLKESIDAVNWGESPGGLKEIPLLAADGARALSEMAGTGVGEIMAVRDELDQLTATSDRGANQFVANYDFAFGELVATSDRALDQVTSRLEGLSDGVTIPLMYTETGDTAETGRAAGFAHGTGGRFLDFGRGTPVLLHGRERVMTEREGRHEGTSLAQVASELHEVRRLLRDQPRAMGIALKEAWILAR